MGPQLTVENLTQRYDERVAVAGPSLELQPGQFVALLGPNGAGKSTLFQMLTGLFAASQGEVLIGGISMRAAPAAALRRLGVVFQQMSLDPDLTVERKLHFHAALHGLPRALANQRIASGCAALGIAADLARPVRELSVGNRRKVELVRALLHRGVNRSKRFANVPTLK